MAVGPFGNFGSPVDPMTLLRLRAMQANPNAQAGDTPLAAPVAPPPVAPAVPSPSSGGGSGFMGGIGSALSRAFSGAGIFGSDEGFNEIDPATGITRGDTARANQQSLMKVGLLLMAAGARQSDDSRARMLGAAAQAADNSESLNGFAKSRIEMAKLRLLEKQQLREAATDAQLMSTFGPQGGPVPTVAEGTPVAAPAGGGAVPAPVPTGGAGPASAAPGATPGAPGASTPVSGAPGGLPAGVDPASLPTQPPGAPPRPNFNPDPAERAAIAAMLPAERRQYISRRMAEVANDVVQSGPYLDPKVGAVMVDQYKGGVKVGTVKLADAPASVSVTPGQEPGERIVRKTDATGRVLDEKREYSPQETRLGTAEVDVLKTDRNNYMKRFEEEIKPSVNTYTRLTDLREKVLTDKSVTGTGTSVIKAAFNLVGSLDALPKELVEKMRTSDLTQSELSLAAGEFAKKYMGPQVSERDIINAQEFMGAVASNDKYRVATALDRIIDEKERSIQGYNESVDFHNQGAPREFLKARKADFKPVPRKPVTEYVPRENTSAAPGTGATPAVGAPAGGGIPKTWTPELGGPNWQRAWELLPENVKEYYRNLAKGQ